MTKPNQRLLEIKQWAKGRSEVRTLILYGSQVQKRKVDPLSDIDLALFTTDLENLIGDTSWTHTFGSVWLSTLRQEGTTHLLKVLYDDGSLVDFALHPHEDLLSMHEHLPAVMEPGYKILIDKDKTARNLPKASGKTPTPPRPTPADVHATLQAFWMDAYHLAKYLLRSELWRAKHYDWQLKQHLLLMMGWHAHLIGKQQHFSTCEGRRLKEWADPEIYISLMTIFGRFYPADAWRALEDTLKRFNQLSEEVANILNADHQPELSEKFQTWLNNQQKNSD